MYFRVSNVKSCGIKGYRIPPMCMDKLNYITFCLTLCPPVMTDEEGLASHSFETKLIIQLSVYTCKAMAGSGKNKKKTESKAKKTKKVAFTLSSDNHLEFLQCLLTKHRQNTFYKVTEWKTFGFKYLYSALKVYVTMGFFWIVSILTILTQWARCHWCWKCQWLLWDGC